VLQAKPPAPAEAANPGQAEQVLAPIRDLVLGVARELEARRSVARITVLEPKDIAGQFRTEEYSLHNNAGRHRILRIGFMLKPTGKIPCLTLHGLDQHGDTEIAPLLEDGRIPADRMDQVLDVLEQFLTRFLAGARTSSAPSDHPAGA
jgi:hypothetical protein